MRCLEGGSQEGFSHLVICSQIRYVICIYIRTRMAHAWARACAFAHADNEVKDQL